MSALYVFTRDLRLEDNKTLYAAYKAKHKYIIPIFIFTPEQITTNSYRSDNSVQFMLECLEELSKKHLNRYGTRLFCFYGEVDTVLAKIFRHDKEIKHLYVTKDYSKYAKSRERKMDKICRKHGIGINIVEDHMLIPAVTKDDGTSYCKYTPYYRKAKSALKSALKPVITPAISRSKIKFWSKRNTIPFELTPAAVLRTCSINYNDKVAVRGGRLNALKLMKKCSKYSDKSRNYPSRASTMLSAYLKFGVVSPREVYIASKRNKALLRQLIWRDFYMQLTDPGKDVPWDKMKQFASTAHLTKWKNGTTGIPIIDAGMRQLNESGWMHNRVRMIVANFLTKILLHDWHIGEKYFAQHLVDYDIYNNNGGWQWSAGTGVDSQPYYRVFNPWRQAKKYDSECVYIKKWIPELRDVDNKVILAWDKKCGDVTGVDYPDPMISEAQTKANFKIYKRFYR